ncbi:MAG: lysophospholipid acyltransferase family protein, partial [Planctomycetes bacterium]|nr:lysophospholipid acyltransferase family protein [Planctomycetota bacterium]
LKKEFPEGHVIFVTAHLGNWELLSRFLSREIESPVLSIYKPHSRPRLNEFLRFLRHDGMQRTVEKEGALVAFVRHLRKKGCVGMLVDQHADAVGVPSVFLGRACRSWDFAVRLAHSTGCPLVPVSCVREDGRFRILWTEALVLPQDGQGRWDTLAATRAVDDALSSMVAQFPQQWLWAGRRWGRHFDSPG